MTTWERVDLVTLRSQAWVRITKGPVHLLAFNLGASELLRRAKWVVFYVDPKTKTFAVGLLKEFEIGAAKVQWSKKGKGWCQIHHPQFVAKIMAMGAKPSARLMAVPEATNDRQVVFKFGG
jgi:hypothetical protein